MNERESERGSAERCTPERKGGRKRSMSGKERSKIKEKEERENERRWERKGKK